MRTAPRPLRLGLFAAVAFAASALLAPSTSRAAVDECLIQFDGGPTGTENGGAITCNDCDPTCDTGAVGTKDNQCVFNLRACVLQSCSAGTTIKKAKVKPNKAGITAGTASSPCGSFVGVTVKLKKQGKKAGKLKLKATAKADGSPKRNDSDKLTLTCNPQAAATCPTTTTTTTLPPAACGNGVLDGTEECDSPNIAACAPNEGCVGAGSALECTCQTIGPCDCGAPAPTALTFLNSVGSGPCGSVTPPVCVQGNAVGTPCSSNADCVTAGGGICIGDLICSALYFGGAGVATPLPATVPDMGRNFMGVGGCFPAAAGQAKQMNLTPTAPGDVGATIRNCTRGDVPNPDYPACAGGSARDGGPCRLAGDCPGNTACTGAGQPGACCTGLGTGTCVAGTCTGSQLGCLFGPPLPIPNPLVPATSVCIVNRVVQNASGTGNCGDGSSSISLPLASDLYLTGDLLDPAPAGIQPCPLCETGTCTGGPNNGAACTVGSGDLGDAYPTSHDCPPPSTAFIGALPIPFALSTGTQTKVSVDRPPLQDNVFCGFCSNSLTLPNFRNPPTACSSNADCTAADPAFGFCKQRTAGAFGNGLARTITASGSPAGDITDRQPHPSTLVSVFCIPPSYNGIVDGAGDLPGPGAVSLPGAAQLLP